MCSLSQGQPCHLPPNRPSTGLRPVVYLRAILQFECTMRPKDTVEEVNQCINMLEHGRQQSCKPDVERSGMDQDDAAHAHVLWKGYASFTGGERKYDPNDRFRVIGECAQLDWASVYCQPTTCQCRADSSLYFRASFTWTRPSYHGRVFVAYHK
jgi:hypothetical protein